MKNVQKKRLATIILFVFITIFMWGNVNIYAATIGEQLKTPERGWKRYDNTDGRIKYTGEWLQTGYGQYYYNGTGCYSVKADTEIRFEFYGTKFRYISTIFKTISDNISISFDSGVTWDSFSGYSEKPLGYSDEEVLSLHTQSILYEKTNLKNEMHSVIVKFNGTGALCLDAIDIDEDGYIVNPNESISLDKSSLNLTVGDSQQLIATTIPVGAEIEWISSDETVASVYSDGTVKALKFGVVTITAKIKGSETKATCEVTVTDKAVDPGNAEAGILRIEMVDGNIKEYNVTATEFTDFTNWYIARDRDDTESPIYKFQKSTGKEYLVHNKIVGFEIR